MAFVGVSLVLGSPGLDPAFQEWPHQSWAERKDHLTQFVGNTSPNAAQDTIHFLCLKCRMLDYDQLGVHQDPWVLFCQALSTDLCLRLFFPKCGTSQFLLNLMASIPAHFPSLLCSLWMPAQPSGVSATSACLSLTNLLWVHSAPSPRLTLSRVSSVAQTWWSQQSLSLSFQHTWRTLLYQRHCFLKSWWSCSLVVIPQIFWQTHLIRIFKKWQCWLQLNKRDAFLQLLVGCSWCLKATRGLFCLSLLFSPGCFWRMRGQPYHGWSLLLIAVAVLDI